MGGISGERGSSAEQGTHRGTGWAPFRTRGAANPPPGPAPLHANEGGREGQTEGEGPGTELTGRPGRLTAGLRAGAERASRRGTPRHNRGCCLPPGRRPPPLAPQRTGPALSLQGNGSGWRRGASWGRPARDCLGGACGWPRAVRPRCAVSLVRHPLGARGQPSLELGRPRGALPRPGSAGLRLGPALRAGEAGGEGRRRHPAPAPGLQACSQPV